MNNQNSTPFNDFISFRKFISLTFIQVLYVIGAVVITIAGIVFLVQAVDSRHAGELTLSGLGLLVVGNLLWRVICEAWILFFRLASSVGNIENSLKYSSKSVPFENTPSNAGLEIVCEYCGKVQSDADSKFCEECGKELLIKTT